MKTISKQLPLHDGAWASKFSPQIIMGKDGSLKIIFSEKYKGFAWLDLKDFALLVDEAKKGMFDGIVHIASQIQDLPPS